MNVESLQPWVSGQSLVLTIMIFIVYGSLAVFVGPYADARRRAGDVGLLETKWRIEPGGPTQLLKRLGAAGRAIYRRAQFVDLLFPLVFAPAVTESILNAVAWAATPSWVAALVLPAVLIGSVFDWSENVAILRLVAAYPDEPGGLVAWLRVATPAKLALAFACGAAAVIVLIASALHALCPA